MFLFPKAEDRSPWGDFWFTPIGSNTASNVRVNGDNAMRLSTVYACIRVLSETFAMLPFQLSQVVNGKRTYITDHWLYQLLHLRPNQYQNAFEWHEMMIGHLALRGNAYNRIVTAGDGSIAAFIPIHPDRVKMEIASDGGYRYRVHNQDGSWTIYARGDIWHLRGLSSDGYMGLTPIEIHSQTIGLGIGVNEYAARYFANNASPGGGWIEHPSYFKDKADRDIFKDSWQTAYSGGNRHKTAILEFGMKYHDLPVKNNEAQFLETRQFQVIDICRIFRVPPHLVMDLTRGTFSNIEQQSLEFMSYTMAPWAGRVEASIIADFLPENDGWQVEYDFTHLMRGDAASRSKYYQTGIVAGWLTRNEARVAEGYEKLDGLDDPLMPLNMAPAGETPQETVPGEIEQDPDSDAEDPDGEGVAPAVHRIAASTATRIIRKEIAAARRALDEPDAVKRLTDFYASHAELVSDAFAVDMPTARAWCDAQLQVLHTAPSPLQALRQWEVDAPLRLARQMCR